MESIYKELSDYIVYPYDVRAEEYEIIITIFPNGKGKICNAITNKLLEKMGEFGIFNYVTFQDNKWVIYFKKN